jgi:hypothetical protein
LCTALAWLAPVGGAGGDDQAAEDQVCERVRDFPAIAKHNIPIPGGTRDMYDLMGKDAMVFRYSQASGEAADAQFTEQARTWFDSIWDTISYEYPA